MSFQFCGTLSNMTVKPLVCGCPVGKPPPAKAAIIIITMTIVMPAAANPVVDPLLFILCVYVTPNKWFVVFWGC